VTAGQSLTSLPAFCRAQTDNRGLDPSRARISGLVIFARGMPLLPVRHHRRCPHERIVLLLDQHRLSSQREKEGGSFIDGGFRDNRYAEVSVAANS